MIPKIGDEVILIKDDYYSERKAGERGIIDHVSIWYRTADVIFNDGSKRSIYFDILELVD